MSIPAVVDSSVVLKWLHGAGEDHVSEAADTLRAHLSGALTLVAPSTMPTEVTNALRSKPRLEPRDVAEFVDALEVIGVATFEVTYARLHEAIELAYRHRLTVYDALFLQLAAELDCPLVTADRRAFAGLEGCDVEVRLL